MHDLHREAGEVATRCHRTRVQAIHKNFRFNDWASVSTRDISPPRPELVLSDLDEGPYPSVPDRSSYAAYPTAPGIRGGQERRLQVY